jgi:ABC-type lipoprotein release transport system permease subunit
VLALVTAAGVVNTTLLASRERVHDLATLQSLGMTPTQITSTTAVSPLVVTAIAAAQSMPIGIWLRAWWGAHHGFIAESRSLSPLSSGPVIARASWLRSPERPRPRFGRLAF